jgi:hypothetical protein
MTLQVHGDFCLEYLRKLSEIIFPFSPSCGNIIAIEKMGKCFFRNLCAGLAGEIKGCGKEAADTNKKQQKLMEPGMRLYLVILLVFAAATLFFDNGLHWPKAPSSSSCSYTPS